ncbi:hypothetical protein K6I33_006036, partial [Streptomyces sp. UNOB3_S3]|nr:hypothetical protein [Streptomyces sp. UNOB3_S3]
MTRMLRRSKPRASGGTPGGTRHRPGAAARRAVAAGLVAVAATCALGLGALPATAEPGAVRTGPDRTDTAADATGPDDPARDPAPDSGPDSDPVPDPDP